MGEWATCQVLDKRRIVMLLYTNFNWPNNTFDAGELVGALNGAVGK